MTEPEGTGAGCGKKRVLVVEDDKNFHTVLRIELHESGFDVACCADSGTALQLSTERSFDCFVLDQGALGVQVLEFTRSMRQRFPEAVIIGMSGHLDVNGFTKSGGDLFLSKPIVLRHLIQALNSGAAASSGH